MKIFVYEVYKFYAATRKIMNLPIQSQNSIIRI